MILVHDLYKNRKELYHDAVRVFEIKKGVYENNDREAEKLRARLKGERLSYEPYVLSRKRKTTTCFVHIEQLKDKFRIGVMEADIDSAVDAETIATTGVKAIQLHTGGMCHLDAA
jgi:hydrogenase nickel incorporation protein HypB